MRDFLLLFFFVDLGVHLNLSELGFALAPALVLSLFVLIGNPLIVMAIMGWMGYRKRTGFLAGLTVAQISEFSLMLGALGKNLGHIDSDVLGLITLVGNRSRVDIARNRGFGYCCGWHGCSTDSIGRSVGIAAA